MNPQIEKMELWQFALLISIIIGVFVIILITIIRWMFRIDTIVSLLKEIRDSTCPQNSLFKDLPPLQLCDGCHRNFEKTNLRRIDSGQFLCPECIENLKNRRI